MLHQLICDLKQRLQSKSLPCDDSDISEMFWKSPFASNFTKSDGTRKNMLSHNHVRKMFDNERMSEHGGRFHPVVEQWLRWELAQ